MAGPGRSACSCAVARSVDVPERSLTARSVVPSSSTVAASADSGKKTHLILGWHIVGPSATDMISEGALSLEMAAVLEDVALTVHPHPTLGEAVMVAAQHALGHAIDILNK